MIEYFHTHAYMQHTYTHTHTHTHTHISAIPSVNLDSLLVQLRPQVTTRWYQFGEAAGIEKEVLKGFLKSCSPCNCIVEMLDYWLRKSVVKPTWRDIAGVLRLINLSKLANDIERVYATGTYKYTKYVMYINYMYVYHYELLCNLN